jgi:hypothetical protein
MATASNKAMNNILLAFVGFVAVAVMPSCVSPGGSFEGIYTLPGGKATIRVEVPLYRIPLARPKLPDPPKVPEYEPEPMADLFPEVTK